MASVSLVVSSPPPPTTTTAPVLDKNMTDSELAGEEREDGELEDGEIDDEGIGIEEENRESKEVNEDGEKKDREKEKGKEKEDKIHRHSRKRSKKTREKRRSKRRRRDRPRHHSPSSTSSSDSYDSEHDWDERPKPRKSQGSNREPDGQTSQHGRDPKAGHGNSQKSPQHKTSDLDKYSDYSDDKYDYEEEEDDYTDEMSEYQHPKDSGTHGNRGRHAKRGNMRGGHKQFGQRGRGRGNGTGRGRGMLNKNNKKLKGKTWGGRGRGRGGEQATEGGMKPEGKNSSGFQKKRPIMSKEFINQHTVEHNGRYICKYFLEGRCIKGEQCKFEHELVVPDKKKELCKFYLQGYCSKGDNCIYMHNEYPCKFFHTGAKCYQGENCKFSHDALNDVTKELLNKIINTEEENAHDDELELEDLRKQGIAPLPKPPPGVGLLPTPGHSSPTEGKKIPSLFEIKVQPTVDLQQKIALSGSQYQDDGSEQLEDTQSGNNTTLPSGSNVPTVPPPDSPGPPGSAGHPAVPPMPQSPPGQHPPPHGCFPMPPPPLPPGGPPPPFHGNRPNMNPPMNMHSPPPFPPMPPELQMLQSLFPFPSLGPNPVEFFSSFLRNQAMNQGVDPSLAFMQSLQQQMGAESQMQSLPPAVQKALFLHVTQQQQQQHPPQQGVDSQRGDGQDDMGTNKDETPNWYSSDDEDGSCMASILKSLQRQKEQQQQQSQPKPPQQPPSSGPALGDPRLQKEPRVPPSDPRMKMDPRQRPPDTRKELDGAVDPRLARDPRKVRPTEPNSYRQQQQKHPASHNKPPASGGDEDEEGEREIKDRAALIPLDACPGAVLRDPRCQLKQFSHIRVDILLQRPTWAQTVVWAPEDLIPLLVPKQEHSINLPLPPLIADAQMNRASRPDYHQQQSPAVTSPPPIDPRLAAARLKEGVVRMPSRVMEPRTSTDRPRPLDPRQHKTLDPRIKRTLSLDSKLALQKDMSSSGGGGGVVDPRLQRASAGTTTTTSTPLTSRAAKPDPDKLPPYAPRLSSSSGGGLESPTAILGGISLYDPRSQAEQQAAQAEPPKKTGILKHPGGKRENNIPPRSLSPPKRRRGSVEEAAVSAAENADPGGSGSGPSDSVAALGDTPAAAPPPPPASPAKPPAVHNLPVQALIRPQYSDPRQAKVAGGGALQEEEKEEEEQKKQEKTEEKKQEKTEEPPEEEEPKQEVEEEETDDDRTLKDVFKTFDPTASPFCQ